MTSLLLALVPSFRSVATTPNTSIDTSYRLDIEKGSLTAALRQLALQTHLQIARFSDSGGDSLQVGPLRGTYVLAEALRSLLRGTGLTYRFIDGDTIAILPEQTSVRPLSKLPAQQQQDSAATEPGPQNEPDPKHNSQPAGHRGFLAHLAAIFTLCSMAAANNPACAQDSAAAASAAQPALEEVVVTGTLIRGIAPVGTNVIAVTQDQIAATGAVSTQQLLAAIPQITNAFNATPSVGTGVGGLTVVRPNIRNLAANGGNTTLVLLDGHNIVGAGVLQTTADVGVIPPGALERIDVVPDGNSSLYGSDAIGGIVNLITRRHQEGVEFDGHYGFANSYRSGDAGLTAGHEWSSGSFLLAYNFRDNSNLLGADRDYFRQDLAPFGGNDNRVTACEPGNVTVNAVNYALPGLAPGVNRCDQDLYRDIFPQEKQHSAFARLTQHLADQIQFEGTFYYARRQTDQRAAQDATSGVVINSTNPYFHSITGETQQTVAYSYAAAFGPSLLNRTDLEEFGVTPQLTFTFNPNWDLTLLGNFGWSKTTAHSPEVNSVAEAAALAGTTTATALDSYNIAATNTSVLSAIGNYEQYAQSVQKLTEARVIASGSLVHLPGGDLRLATGAQYQRQTSSAAQTDAPVGDLSGAARAAASRNVSAVFAETLIPIVDRENAVPAIRSLAVDGSVRYDHYSDFGGSTNPKVGITYQPFQELTIRASGGTSFNAPSLADTAGAVDTRAQVIPISPFQKSFSTADLVRPTILLAGGNANLRPQTAHTYSVGADFHSVAVSGLELSLTYWKVLIKDVILVTPFFSSAIFTNPGLSGYYVLNPTLAQAQALIGSEHIQGPSLATLYAGGSTPYAIFNAQRNNLGTLNVNGLDFNGRYTAETPVGTVTASLGGTVTLDRTSTIAGSPPFDELANAGVGSFSPLSLTGTLGTRYRQLTARILVNYSKGFSVVGIPNQARVDSFHPVNLFFAYDSHFRGFLENLTVSLNIDNVFDDRPPFLNQTSTVGIDGVGNGMTLGRVINFGLHKQF